MSELIYKLVNINYLTTGRRLYALRQCLALAQVRGAADLVSLFEEAIAHDVGTVEMERSWARSKKVSTARGEAFNLDNQIDALYGVMHSNLQGHKTVLPSDHPAATAASRIISQLFPEGILPIISLPFEDQLIINDSTLARLNGDLQQDAETAGISHLVARFDTLNEAFRAELAKTQSKETDYDVIEAAQAKGNLNLRRATTVILGTYHRDNEEDAAARQTLLQPILDQCDRVRQSRKGRRAPQDVDPDTGEEVPSDEVAV